MPTAAAAGVVFGVVVVVVVVVVAVVVVVVAVVLLFLLLLVLLVVVEITIPAISSTSEIFFLKGVNPWFGVSWLQASDLGVCRMHAPTNNPFQPLVEGITSKIFQRFLAHWFCSGAKEGACGPGVQVEAGDGGQRGPTQGSKFSLID